MRASPGQWVTIANAANTPSAMMMMMTAVVPVLVVAAAPVPSVMVTASSMELVAVTVTMPMLDLDQGTVLNGQRSDAYPGGSGCGHGKRSNKCSTNQNDTSHADVLLHRVIAMMDTSSRHMVLFRCTESKLYKWLFESYCLFFPKFRDGRQFQQEAILRRKAEFV
jgi:hypothetical protein